MDLYIKPTDKHLYLMHNSCQPRSCKDGILFAQETDAVCSTLERFERKAKELAKYFYGARL